MKKTILPVLALIFLAAAVATATASDKIFFWTDENGVKHYTDTGRPGDGPEAADVEVEGKITSKNRPLRRRPAYDKMDRGVNAETANREAQERKEKLKKEQKEKEKAAALRKAEITAKKAVIQAQIAAIQARGLGPYYTKGMKEAQIKPLQEKLDELEKEEK